MLGERNVTTIKEGTDFGSVKTSTHWVAGYFGSGDCPFDDPGPEATARLAEAACVYDQKLQSPSFGSAWRSPFDVISVWWIARSGAANRERYQGDCAYRWPPFSPFRLSRLVRRTFRFRLDSRPTEIRSNPTCRGFRPVLFRKQNLFASILWDKERTSYPYAETWIWRYYHHTRCRLRGI
jgi:hypothetical protein